MALYRDRGVVLRTYRLGEADRIVVFLTQGRGKVRGVAKGVRKTRSKFGSRLEPTSHLNLQLYETRGDLDIVTQVESIDVFRHIREDLDRLNRCTALLEATDHLTLEGEPNGPLYKMLVGALTTIETRDHPLVVPAFLLKALSMEGFRPELDACIECQTTEDLVAFDPADGGVLCRPCRRGLPISVETLELSRMVLGGRLAPALDLPITPATHDLEVLSAKLFEFQLDRPLRSLRPV